MCFRCLGLNNKSVLAFSNRAMAYLKLKEYARAEADCTLALELDGSHVKSLHRRAVARNALGKHRAALSDLMTATRADPSAKEIRIELGKTREVLKSTMRHAPKQEVKVEVAPQPTPRPRPFLRSSPLPPPPPP
ncbi:unnamed protein product, partial [Discosporangium mesarthrocarpum]